VLLVEGTALLADGKGISASEPAGMVPAIHLMLGLKLLRTTNGDSSLVPADQEEHAGVCEKKALSYLGMYCWNCGGRGVVVELASTLPHPDCFSYCS
jgi:hypothetical protein